MIDDPRGRIDYDASGSGPTIVLVPGSCSTGAAWRPVVAEWQGGFRCITTSLLGYGGTEERRSVEDADIAYEAEIVEAVIARADRPVHLVGHSFGGIAALAVAMRDRVPLQSLTVIEAPAAEALWHMGEHRHYRAFRDMTNAYFAAYEDGEREAIAGMIDFYGGAGTFAGWPQRVRDYAVATTPVNILDWASAYGFRLSATALEQIAVPTLVVRGGDSHPAVQRANELVALGVRRGAVLTLPGAAHFMIATHAAEVAHVVAHHVLRAEESEREVAQAC